MLVIVFIGVLKVSYIVRANFVELRTIYFKGNSNYIVQKLGVRGWNK